MRRAAAERRYSVAIVGCGRIAGVYDRPASAAAIRTHAQAFHRHSRFRLEAACEREPERLNAFCATWQISGRFERLDDLLQSETPDVLCICSPTAEHFAQVMAVLTHRPDVPVLLVEKPVCRTSDELRAIRNAAGRCQTAVMVNHTRRFDVHHRNVAYRMTAGEFGALVGGRCEYSGGWLNNGTHLVDTLRMLLGTDPVVRSAVHGAPGREGDPCHDAELCFGGVPVHVTSVDERRYQLFEIDLRFEAARVRLESFGTEIRVQRKFANERGDKLLRPEPPLSAMDAALFQAASTIADELDGTASFESRGVHLGEVERTMNVVWSVRRMAQAEGDSR